MDGERRFNNGQRDNEVNELIVGQNEDNHFPNVVEIDGGERLDDELDDGRNIFHHQLQNASDDGNAENGDNDDDEQDNGRDNFLRDQWENASEDDSNEENAVDNEGNSDDDNEDDDENENRPLYDGAQITVGQSMLLILALLLHFNLSMSCVESYITVLQFHCLQENLVKNSLYKFKKYFGFLGASNIIKHFFCSACFRQLESADHNCVTCLTAKNSYFIELSFIDQLKEMYARPGFYNLLQSRFQRMQVPGIISDVYDGRLYQTWINNGFLANQNNISFSFLLKIF